MGNKDSTYLSDTLVSSLVLAARVEEALSMGLSKEARVREVGGPGGRDP